MEVSGIAFTDGDVVCVDGEGKCLVVEINGSNGSALVMNMHGQKMWVSRQQITGVVIDDA